MSSTEKCWLAKKCHLNFTTFCWMWLKWSTRLKHMPLTHICSHSSVRGRMQSTHVLSHTQRWDGFLKLDHWPEFLNYESNSRDFCLKIFYLFIFRERGRDGEREGEKHQCVIASCVPTTGHLSHNPGMCPDWESDQRPIGSQGGTQSTEPHQPGPEISFRKTVTTGSMFHWHRMGHKTRLLVWHSQPAHIREEWQLCSIWQRKWLDSKPNWNYRGDKWKLGCLTFQTLAEILKETESRPSSPSWCMITCHAFQKSRAFLPNHQRALSSEGMDLRPIVNKPGESPLSVLEEYRLVEITYF